MGDRAGIRMTISRHADGNPLHWRLTSRCPHGRFAPDVVVGRREVILSCAIDLGHSHRAETRCACLVVGLEVEE